MDELVIELTHYIKHHMKKSTYASELQFVSKLLPNSYMLKKLAIHWW